MKILALISGGFDSGVAAYLVQKKGHDVIGLHFSSYPFTNKEPEEKSKKIAAKLGIKLKVVNIGNKLEQISKETEREYYFVLMKRLFLKLAEKIAKKEGCSALLIGDSLAQVSSQTLQNIYVIDEATKMQVIRPLIGFNKQEIINLTKELGLYDIAVGPEQCDVLGPTHPSTQADLETVKEEEKKD